MDLQVLVLDVSTASFVSKALEHSGGKGRSLRPGDSLESFPVFWFNISDVLPIIEPSLKVHIFLLILLRKWE